VILVSLSVPAFWLGLLTVIALAAWFGVFPGYGYASVTTEPIAHIAALVPAVAILALRPAALVARVVRSGTFEVAGQGFVLAARARGVSRWRVARRHMFRVGALPAIPVLGVQVVYLLGGSVVVEQVFGLPGVGRAMLDAVSARDYPVIQFLVVLFACAAVVASMAADMAQAILDPRVRRR
jgi:peptide/nickel transport system permease protein